jgi:hypothetical protein
MELPSYRTHIPASCAPGREKEIFVQKPLTFFDQSV